MKKTVGMIPVFVLALLLTGVLGACSAGTAFNSNIQRDNISFSIADDDTLSEWEDEGEYTLHKGNLALLNSLLFDGTAADIDMIKESEAYQKMTKIGVTFEGDETESAEDAVNHAAELLQSCFLYAGDAVYEPYYVLVGSGEDSHDNRAILLYESDLSLPANAVFANRKDNTIVICGEDAAGAVKTVNVKAANENAYGLSYSVSDYGTADENFEAGNTCYKDGKFEEAEYLYLMALNKMDTLSDYTADDVTNNLVLAKLQLEKNAEALRMATDLVSRHQVTNQTSTAETKNTYGYLINFLIAAHANQLKKDDALRDCSDISLSEIEKKLTEQADNDPGEFVRFMTALIYNDMYMEMEEANNKDWLEDIMSILVKLNKKEKKTFDKEDPDINELKKYLSAKINALES